jgi:hypothetical protein
MTTSAAAVRLWATAAAAMLAAATADAGTELAENSGWLGGAVRDNQHEAILPALVIGAAMALSLLGSVLFARISPRDELLRLAKLRTRFNDIAVAFCGSVFCIVAMEAYETRFGGVAPFDPRSVVLSHTLALLAASLLMVAVVHWALRVAIGVARRASIAVAGFIVEFLGRRPHVAAAHHTTVLSAFERFVRHVPLGIARGSRGFRAPPRSIVLSTS